MLFQRRPLLVGRAALEQQKADSYYQASKTCLLSLCHELFALEKRE